VEKMYKKLPHDQNICPMANGCNIFHMGIKYNKIFHSKALPNLPKLVFLF
jgi:hypothetical protein